VTAGTDLTGGGNGGTVTLNLDTTKVPQLSAANSFIGNQNVTGNLTATGTITGGSFSGNGSGLTGVGTISGVTAGTDLTGGGTSGTVTLNLDTTRVPQLAAKNTFTVNQNFKGNGNTAQIGDMGCGSGYVGLSLYFDVASCTDYALLGDTQGNLYMNRPPGGAMFFRENNGTELSIAAGGAITAGGPITAASFIGDGSKLTNIGSLAGSNTYTGNNTFAGNNTFSLNTTFSGNGESDVIGDMGCGSNSVGIGVFYLFGTPCSTYALLDYNGQTILNRAGGKNMSFREGNGPDQMTIFAGGGVEVVGTPTHIVPDAVPFWPTSLWVENDTTDTTTSAIFEAIDPNTNSNNSFCWIDTNGNLMCTGSKSAVVPVDEGGRNVALYAVESPENWFEDYGGGTLVNGSSTVTLDPVFAQTVNTGTDYRVFVTPDGDCRGLYVTRKTPTSFEVHELGGGQANIDFDYRIIARRKGYENIRLGDKTEMVKGMKDRVLQRAAAAKKP
jgi:hypothetical protein